MCKEVGEREEKLDLDQSAERFNSTEKWSAVKNSRNLLLV